MTTDEGHADKLRRMADIHFSRQEPQAGDLKRAAERIEQLEREIVFLKKVLAAANVRLDHDNG